MEKLLKEIADKVDGYSQRISGFFIDWVTGAGEAKTNFTDFAVSMLRQLAQMTVQMLVFDKLVKTVAQTVAGWNLSGGMGDMLATAQGAAFSGGHVLPLARGGVVTRPTVVAMAGGMGLMGEAGPEAVMPLKRGADGKLGVSGGSTVNVTVVNNAAGAKARTEEDRQPDGTVNVRVMIEDVVDTAFKRGRFDGSMRESFGAARRGRM
jgi:phage-related minor tail protein